jgi:putative membrane protein
MGKILAKLLITALSLLVISYLVPGIVVSDFYIALLVALIFGLLAIFVKPFLIFLTLPINILTFGLFTLVINGFLFWFVARFVSGFEVSTFLAAFVGALVLSALSWIGEKALR